MSRVAIVHDWLPVYAGAERVLEQIIKVFPHADLFSMVDLIPQGQRAFLGNKPVATSFLQGWKWVRNRYRAFLPLMPLAVEQFDLSQYDLVISSSYAVAKGVLTGPEQLHICYCHSPMRYAWDLQHQYLRETGLDRKLLGWVVRALLHYLRNWDVSTHPRVDHFLTNSEFVKKRIHRVYRRDATVIHPPVDVEGFALEEQKDNYYLTASRLVPYKMVGLVVDAFAKMPDLQLRVIGDGPDFARIKSRAASNVAMLGFQEAAELHRQMQRAKAFVFAAEEDFGIVPVEAQACGTPVIAYGRGGVKETVRPGVTGLFFEEQTTESIVAAVRTFESKAATFQPPVIRGHALRFSAARFRNEFRAFVAKKWCEFGHAEELFPAEMSEETGPTCRTLAEIASSPL